MKETLRRVAVQVVGWAFILLGIAGLFLPVLQGILFILIGLLILSRDSPMARRVLHWLRERFPKVARQLDAAGARSRALLGRLGANRRNE